MTLRLEITDEETFIDWALDNAPGLLRAVVGAEEIAAALSAGRIRAQEGSDVPLIMSMDTGELVEMRGAVLRAKDGAA